MNAVARLDEIPADHAAFRRRLYEGVIVRLAPTPESLALVAAALERVEAALGRDGRAREAQFRLDDAAWFLAVGALRLALFEDREVRLQTRAVVAACGFDPAHVVFDPVRLRAVPHEGYTNPRAAP